MKDVFDEQEERSPDERYDSAMKPLKEHSDLWFWWRDQDFFHSAWEHITIIWSAFKWGIIFMITFVFILVGGRYMDNQQEADTWEYREVAKWTEEYPQLASQVEEALSDNVLTEGEYEDIEEVYEHIDKQSELNKARSMIDEVLQQQ